MLARISQKSKEGDLFEKTPFENCTHWPFFGSITYKVTYADRIVVTSGIKLECAAFNMLDICLPDDLQMQIRSGPGRWSRSPEPRAYNDQCNMKEIADEVITNKCLRKWQQ